MNGFLFKNVWLFCSEERLNFIPKNYRASESNQKVFLRVNLCGRVYLAFTHTRTRAQARKQARTETRSCQKSSRAYYVLSGGMEITFKQEI